MGLFSWFWDALSFLSMKKKDAKLIFLGLDNAGKSTLLQMLKDNRAAVLKPTVFPNAEELVIGRMRFRTFDMGGHETARRIWKDYYASVDGIVFIVDAADRTRFEEAHEELHRLLDEPSLEGVPIVVMGNKIDIPIAASEDELRHALGLFHHMTHGKDVKKGATATARPVELFMVTVVKRMGYAEGFQWLSQFLK